MKKLKELLNGVNVGKVYGDTDREIGHIHFDSRKIEPGDVFIAQRGVNADGHAFIDKALTRGAVAVVCEQLPENRPGNGSSVLHLSPYSALRGNHNQRRDRRLAECASVLLPIP